jgi:hypothetical protein
MRNVVVFDLQILGLFILGIFLSWVEIVEDLEYTVIGTRN